MPALAQPELEIKGLEPVRRDQFPLMQRVMSQCLALLFTHQDLSLVRAYFQKEASDALAGRISLEEFILSKEVRLGTYRDKGPPGATVARQRQKLDSRAKALQQQRVPYVVIEQAKGAPLRKNVVSPEECLSNPHLLVHASHYLRLLADALGRVLEVAGAAGGKVRTVIALFRNGGLSPPWWDEKKPAECKCLHFLHHVCR